jgi:Domain of unknown function (DUF4395)
MPDATDPTADPRPGIDPRGARFGAAITAVLLLVTLFLALIGLSIAATVLLAVIALLFAWGAFAGIRRHPYGRLYATLLRPRLGAPAELEDPAPPTFAQGVGLLVTGFGLVLALLGVPFAVEVASAAAFVAAFLNAVFAYCLGCQIYLLLARARIIRSASAGSRG